MGKSGLVVSKAVGGVIIALLIGLTHLCCCYAYINRKDRGYSSLPKGLGKRRSSTVASEGRNRDNQPARKVVSLIDLNKQLDVLLEKQSKKPHGFHSTEAASLVDYEKVEENNLLEVMVVPGKALSRDQVTVEYAARIREAVRLLRRPRAPPALICFTGGVAAGNSIPTSTVGYSWFRKACESQGVSLDGVELFVDYESDSLSEAMNYVIESALELQERRAPGAAAAGTAAGGGGGGGGGGPPRGPHFRLVSQDYHLAQIAAADQGTTRLNAGVLRAIEGIQGSYSFAMASYPFEYARDPATAFLAKTYLLVEELVPVQLHLARVGRGQAFLRPAALQRLRLLAAALEDQVAILHTADSPPRLLTTYRALNLRKIDVLRIDQHTRASNQGIDENTILIDECLEATTATLSEISFQLGPVANSETSFSLEDFTNLASLLERTIQEMRKACDPDRPLDPLEWYTLITGNSADSMPKKKKRKRGSAAAATNRGSGTTPPAPPPPPTTAARGRPGTRLPGSPRRSSRPGRMAWPLTDSSPDLALRLMKFLSGYLQLLVVLLRQPAGIQMNVWLSTMKAVVMLQERIDEAFITVKKEGATAVKVDPPSCTHSNNSATSGETKVVSEPTVPVTAKEFRVGSSNSSSRTSKRKGVVGSGRTSGSSNNDKNDDLSNHTNSRQHDASMTKKKQQQVMKKEEEEKEDHRHQLQ